MNKPGQNFNNWNFENDKTEAEQCQANQNQHFISHTSVGTIIAQTRHRGQYG